MYFSTFHKEAVHKILIIMIETYIWEIPGHRSTHVYYLLIGAGGIMENRIQLIVEVVERRVVIDQRLDHLQIQILDGKLKR